jgi:hypothetical protein
VLLALCEKEHILKNLFWLIALYFSFHLAGFAQAESNMSAMIVGVWTEVESDNCWSNRVEYREDGTKFVTMEFCDDHGNVFALNYVAKWTISEEKIKEVTFSADPELLAMTGLTLPHTEIDTVGELNENSLVIIDNSTPDEPTIYARIR